MHNYTYGILINTRIITRRIKSVRTYACFRVEN